MKWPVFGAFWALTPPQILSDLDEIFTRGSIQGETKCVLRIFERFKTGDTQKLHFWCNFDPPFLSVADRNRK